MPYGQLIKLLKVNDALECLEMFKAEGTAQWYTGIPRCSQLIRRKVPLRTSKNCEHRKSIVPTF